MFIELLYLIMEKDNKLILNHIRKFYEKKYKLYLIKIITKSYYMNEVIDSSKSAMQIKVIKQLISENNKLENKLNKLKKEIVIFLFLSKINNIII